MDIKLNLVRCNKCGHVREKFLVGCPECGSTENKEVDPDKDFEAFVKVTLDSITHGAEYYKANLDDDQKRFFRERIPQGQDWQFYAAFIISTRMMIPWLKQYLSFEQYSDPISIINSRVLYVMSFKKAGEKKQFCDFLNKLNLELTQDGREEIDNLPEENVETDER